MKTVTNEEQQDFFIKLSNYIIDELDDIIVSSDENVKRFFEMVKHYGIKLDERIYPYLAGDTIKESKIKKFFDKMDNNISEYIEILITQIVSYWPHYSTEEIEDFFVRWYNLFQSVLELTGDDPEKNPKYKEYIIIYLTNEFYKTYKK